MKVALVTFHCAWSYGAVLQAHALCRFLTQAGHAVEIVDYRPDAIENPPDWRRDRFRGFHPAHFEWWLTGRRFAAFRQAFLPLSPQIYRSHAELRANPPEADAYVCGSDQIWNPEITSGRLDPAYFLDFAPAGKRRIAYAASLGGTHLSSTCLATFRELVSRLDFISCREAEAAAFVETATGREVATTLDPALLAGNGDASERPEPPARKPYLFAFTLQQRPDLLTAIDTGARELGCPARIANGPWKWWTLPGRPVYPGPGEWVRWVRHSAAVLTDSFHGTVFAILNHRNFIVFPLAGRMADRNPRIVRLLESLGLQDRMVPPADLEAIRQLLHAPMDWADVEHRLAALRLASSRFLLRALSAPLPQR